MHSAWHHAHFGPYLVRVRFCFLTKVITESWEHVNIAKKAPKGQEIQTVRWSNLTNPLCSEIWALTSVKIDAMSSLILVVTSLPASPVLLQVFPVVVRTASFQCVPLMGGPIPVPVWLAVWDSRTISLSLACVVSVTPVPANPARGTRGMISCVVNGCQLMNTREKLGTTLSCLLFLPQSDWQPGCCFRWLWVWSAG